MFPGAAVLGSNKKERNEERKKERKKVRNVGRADESFKTKGNVTGELFS